MLYKSNTLPEISIFTVGIYLETNKTHKKVIRSTVKCWGISQIISTQNLAIDFEFV